MRTILAICMLAMISFKGHCQTEDPTTWFDFWVGKWDVTWTEAGGKTGKGINTVTRILDDKVINENFVTTEGSSKGYRGTSISVYNPVRKQWHQGYADNQGAYFNLIGENLGDKKIFKTELVEKDGKKLIQRMVFYNITKDSFLWDWEKSEDGGKTWTLSWRINYVRIG
jgi:hypothetical protein